MNDATTSVTLLSVVGAALVDSLNPCSFALLLVFIATVIAMVERQSDDRSIGLARQWLLSRGGVYIFGIFVTYLVLGLGLLGALGVAKSLSGAHLVSRAAALVAIGLGLVALQEALVPELGTRLTAHINMPRVRGLVARMSIPGLFGAGVLVGLCTVPCSGTVYLAVLALLSAQTTAVQGIGWLVLYNAVFVLPLLVLLGVAASRPVYRRLTRWQVHHRATLKLATSAMALSVGMLTLSIL